MMPLKIPSSDILSFFTSQNYLVTKNMEVDITGFSSIYNSKHGDVTYCSLTNQQNIDLIESSNASIIICHQDLKNIITKSNSNFIFSSNPRLCFIRCMNKFLKFEKSSEIHPSTTIHSKNISQDVFIGPYSYIGKNVTIGSGTIIYGNVFIYDDTDIGKNVTIHASTVIGSDGFGFARNEKNQLEKFPHIGGVKIYDDVEIGANNCIDRGTLENTVIGSGTKTDNHVHIAHNVKIGSNCLFAAGTTTSGSCVIGDNVFFGTKSTIRDNIKIGNNAFIGIGSVVVKNIKDNESVMGVPARPFQQKT